MSPMMKISIAEKLRKTKRVNKAEVDRCNLRDQLWPGSADWIWETTDSKNVGYARISRLMPWILHLIKILAGGKKTGDPSGVYLELYCRDFGQGIVSISDEEKCAYAAGYCSNRAHRTWRSHMNDLVEMGFIQTMQDGNREYGHVLLLNPLWVCANLRAKAAKKVPDAWWTAFVSRANEIKAKIPDPGPLPGMPGYVTKED